MAGGQMSTAKLKIIEREAVAVQLRLQGGSFPAIAEQMRTMPELEVSAAYDAKAAYRDIQRALTKTQKQTAESSEQVIVLELARLDELLAAWWEAAKSNPVAFNQVMTLMERRARYLGLNAPEKQEHSGAVVGLTLAEWRAQAAERREAAQQAEELAQHV